MPWPSRSRASLSPAPAAAIGADPAAAAAVVLRPRAAHEHYDGAWNLLCGRPALLLPLAALHVLPLGLGVAGLLLLPGRVFDLAGPSLPTALLAVWTAAAMALRPFALAATTLAVSALLAGEPATVPSCLWRAFARARAVLDVAAWALLIDLPTLGLLRLGGARHVLVPLVVLEGRGAASARKEAERLALAHTRARIELNASAILMFLSLFLNLWAGAILLVEAGGFLGGIDLSVARDFVSPRNLSFGLMLGFLTLLALEPVRAVVKGLHFLDLRLREEGSDLKARIARLG